MVNRAFVLIRGAFKQGAHQVLIGSFASKFVAFFSSIFLVRTLSKNEYGILGYVDNLFGYVMLLSGFGLANAILRFLVIESSIESKYGFYRFVQKSGAIFSIILVTFSVLASVFVQHANGFEEARFLLPILLPTVILRFIIDVNLYTQRAMFDAKAYSLWALITSSVIVLSRLFGAVTFGLYGVVCVALAAEIVLCFVLQRIIKTSYFEKADVKAPSEQKRKNAISYSVQMMFTSGLWAMFMLTDIFLVGKLSADPQVLADFKVALVLPANLSILSTSINIFTGPYFTDRAEKRDGSWIKRNTIRVLLGSFLLVGFAALFFYILAPFLVKVLFGQGYLSIVPVMRLLLVSYTIGASVRYSIASILASMGIVKYNLVISFFGLILQTVLTIIFVGKFGLVGVAYSNLVATCMMSLALVFVLVRVIHDFETTKTS